MDNISLLKVNIKLTWDDDAHVWIATSDEVPGLVLESDSFDELIERVRYAVPELLELNGLPTSAILDYHTERHETVFA
ncbi:MAG: DUF1902 domain-containing protein [Flexilinea sp.]|nr:DUF1902 domain-containing protein [Flexilinea sp.]